MIQTIKQGMETEGVMVPMTKLSSVLRCLGAWCTTSPPRAPRRGRSQERLKRPIKALIDQDPSYGYRIVAGLLNMNIVQRIFQIRGSQVMKRPIGFRPRVEALPSVAVSPDQRWRETCAASGQAETAVWPRHC